MSVSVTVVDTVVPAPDIDKTDGIIPEALDAVNVLAAVNPVY